MQTIPRSLLFRFQSELKRLGVRDQAMPHYVKWVRYFMDFGTKYGGGRPNDVLVEPFLAKLAKKGQSAGMREQARHAVDIFLGLAETAPAGVDSELPAVGEAAGRYGRERSSRPAASAAVRAWRDLEVRLVDEIRRRNYSSRTADAYATWVRQFGAFTRHIPVDELTDASAKDFLTYLAVERKVVASTQNQAFNALLFLFRHILQRDYDLKDRVVRAKTTKYIPTVLTKAELKAVLKGFKFPFDLIVLMLYGCGLRLSECLELRVGSLDFTENLVIVHDGKGKKDRSLPMPERLKKDLKRQVKRVEKLLQRDLENPSYGGVFMPKTMGRRRAKAEAKHLEWQWIFPAKELTLVPEEGVYRRYHNHKQHVSKAIGWAVKKAKVPKRVTAHTFRHTFASHLLAANVDLRTIQELLGHTDIKTTMIYTHTIESRVLKDRVSPLDLDEWDADY